MIIQIITTPMHVLWSYIFVNRLGLGLTGTALSSMITTVINTIVIHLYVYFILPQFKEAYFFPTTDSIRGMKDYIKVAFPSMLMACLEWWSIEILTLYASLISVVSIGSQVIILNVMYVYYCTSLGL